MNENIRDRYLAAATFETFLEGVEANRDLWHAVSRRARVPAAFVNRVQATRHPWHLLVLTEDWCGDAVNTLPFIAKLAAAAPNLDLRVLSRDANPDLMDSHLSGESRSIPVVILLDATFVERGWWGSRPRVLQEWVLRDSGSMDRLHRYREIRRWYVQDGAITTFEELTTLIEGAARHELAA